MIKELKEDMNKCCIKTTKIQTIEGNNEFKIQKQYNKQPDSLKKKKQNEIKLAMKNSVIQTENSKKSSTNKTEQSEKYNRF